MFKKMSNSEIIRHLTEQFNEVEEQDQDLLAPFLEHKAHYPVLSVNGKYAVGRKSSIMGANWDSH